MSDPIQQPQQQGQQNVHTYSQQPQTIDNNRDQPTITKNSEHVEQSINSRNQMQAEPSDIHVSAQNNKQPEHLDHDHANQSDLQVQTPLFPNLCSYERPPNMDIQAQIQLDVRESSQEYFQPYQEAEEQNQLNAITRKIKSLQQKQQILKCSIVHHQQANKKLFSSLYLKKKQLLALMQKKSNQSQLQVDIGIMQQFTSMRQCIIEQNQQIYKLQQQINKLGLSGVDTDTNTIQLKQKREQYQKQIRVGSKFASTQYVRDYIEKMHIYKVSYEDVRYQYQTKIKLKQQLQIQKKLYDQKKMILNKNIQQQARLCEQLEQERDQLLVAISTVKTKKSGNK